MRKILILFIVIFQSCVSTKFKCIDKKACIEIEKNLETISDYQFFGKVTDQEALKAGKILEEVSGHKTTADWQIDGLQAPTVTDYITWTSWYSINYNYLRYDKKLNQVYSIKDRDTINLSFNY